MSLNQHASNRHIKLYHSLSDRPPSVGLLYNSADCLAPIPQALLFTDASQNYSYSEAASSRHIRASERGYKHWDYGNCSTRLKACVGLTTIVGSKQVNRVNIKPHALCSVIYVRSSDKTLTSHELKSFHFTTASTALSSTQKQDAASAE